MSETKNDLHNNGDIKFNSQRIRSETAINRRKQLSHEFQQLCEQYENKDINCDEFKSKLKEQNVFLSKKLDSLKSLKFENRRPVRHKSVTFKKSLSVEVTIRLSRSKTRLLWILKHELWSSHIKFIGKKFGSHTAYYFYLFRFLFYLNIIPAFFLFFLLILPQLIYDIQEGISTVNGNLLSNNRTSNEFSDNLADFFTKNSLLYYGHYSSDAWKEGMAFVYLLLNALYIIFTLIFNSYKLGSNYSKNYISENAFTKMFVTDTTASKVFTRWEFMLSNIKSIELQRKQVTYYLREKLQLESKTKHNQTKFRFYVTLITSLLLTLATVAAIICLMILTYNKTILYDVNLNVETDSNILKSLCNAFEDVINSSFALPLLVTLAMYCCTDILNPLITQTIEIYSNRSKLYSKYIQMVKVVLSQIAIIATISVIYLSQLNRRHFQFEFSNNYNNNNTNNSSNNETFQFEFFTNSSSDLNDTQTPQIICWENEFAFDIYQYLIVYLAFMALSTALREWLPALIFCGQRKFDSSRNAFHLTYIQFLCWTATFYSPFAPIVNSLLLAIIFYVKRMSLSVFNTPVVYKGITIDLTIWAHVSLLLGSVITALVPLFTIFNTSPSSICGPFDQKHGNLRNYYYLVINEIDQLKSSHASDFIITILSKTTSVFLVLILCVIVHYTRSISNARKHFVHLSCQQLDKSEKENSLLTKTIAKFKSIQRKTENNTESINSKPIEQIKHRLRRNSLYQ